MPCALHTLLLLPHILQSRAGSRFQLPPWELFSLSTGHSVLGTPEGERSWHQGGLSWAPTMCQALPLAQAWRPRGRDEPPHCAPGETGSFQSALGTLRKLLATVCGFGQARCVGLACPLAAAVRVVWPRGGSCPRSGSQRPGGEVPNPAHRSPTSQKLRTVSPILSSRLPRDPTATACPAPIAMETACTQLPPSLLPCPKCGRQAGPAAGRPGAHEQRGPRDSGRGESEILRPAPRGGESSRALLTLGSWLWV